MTDKLTTGFSGCGQDACVSLVKFEIVRGLLSGLFAAVRSDYEGDKGDPQKIHEDYCTAVDEAAAFLGKTSPIQAHARYATISTNVEKW